jgi:hypothetical protein
MGRTDAAGVGIAFVAHAALLAILAVGIGRPAGLPGLPAPMEVSFVDEIGLVSTAPEPSNEPAAAAMAPMTGPAQDAAPAPSPTPPEPRDVSVEQPRPAQPSARGGAPRQSRRQPLDIDLASATDGPAARPRSAPAAAMSAQAAASIGDAIKRQVQPCADRQSIPYGAGEIVTQINLRLNRDGSLAARPRVIRQLNADGENGRYAQRAADIAIAAFTECSPLRGLPQDLYDVPRGWSNFTLNYRLPG